MNRRTDRYTVTRSTSISRSPNSSSAAVGAPVPQIPPDREDDDLGRNRNPTNAELEILGIGWCDQESSRDALPPTAAFRHFTVPYGLPYPPLKIYGLKCV